MILEVGIGPVDKQQMRTDLMHIVHHSWLHKCGWHSSILIQFIVAYSPSVGGAKRAAAEAGTRRLPEVASLLMDG